ncbi:MAG: NUDIX domain-containing protein [Methanohalobium sp.]|uniref:NUDIX domain-containing protein n=1 Tax=Methanohalobium sp. TaxID=2837493 RepID=UPI00397B8472
MVSETPKITVDAVTILNGKVVLIRRKNPPYQGMFALPGGFVEIGETTENAVLRELNEETGLSAEIVKLLGVYSDPNRDPRGHTISVCYLLIGHGIPTADTDAKEIGIFDITDIPELAFDHNKIINQSREDIYGVLSKM